MKYNTELQCNFERKKNFITHTDTVELKGVTRKSLIS